MSFEKEVRKLQAKTEKFVSDNITWTGNITDDPDKRVVAMLSALTDIVERQSEEGFSLAEMREAVRTPSTTKLSELPEGWRVPLQANKLLHRWYDLFRAAGELSLVHARLKDMRQQAAGVHVP